MSYLDNDVRMYSHAEVKAIVELERAEAYYYAKKEFYENMLKAVQQQEK